VPDKEILNHGFNYIQCAVGMRGCHRKDETSKEHHHSTAAQQKGVKVLLSLTLEG